MNNNFDKYINKVQRYYRDNVNYYHTIYHIINMFKLFNYYQESFEQEFGKYNKEVLCWAIAYHDSFYMPGFSKNEEISAIIAKTELNSIIDVEEVGQLILGTIPSNNYFITTEEKILHDLDWSGFRYWEDLVNNQKKILTEAVEIGKYDQKLVIENQYKFYQQLVDKDIFVTNTFGNRFNKLAKNNLKDILKKKF